MSHNISAIFLDSFWATSCLLIDGHFSILFPSRRTIVLLSPPITLLPFSVLDTSLATMRSAPFFFNYFFELWIRLSVSAANPITSLGRFVECPIVAKISGFSIILMTGSE